MRLVPVVELDVSTKMPDTGEEDAADATFELHHSVDVSDVIRL